MSDATEHVLVAIEEPGLAIVTLNRPEKRNALSLAMWPRMGDIFRDLAANDEVRAVILTGAGGNFSAGADISEFATVRNDATQAASYGVSGAETSQLIRNYPKPIIAAVHGYGVGGELRLPGRRWDDADGYPGGPTRHRLRPGCLSLAGAAGGPLQRQAHPLLRQDLHGG